MSWQTQPLDPVIFGVLAGVAVTGIASVIVAVIYAINSRDSYEAKAELDRASAGKIVREGAMDLLKRANARMDKVERENRHLKDRLDSVDQDARTTRAALQRTEILLSGLEDNYNKLQREHQELQKRYQKLKDQVDHNSRSDLRP